MNNDESLRITWEHKKAIKLGEGGEECDFS
jgi:hypothetical protein